MRSRGARAVGDGLGEPGLWSSAWQCARTAPVDPYTVMEHSGDARSPTSSRGPRSRCGLRIRRRSAGYAAAPELRRRRPDPALVPRDAMSGPGPLGGAADLFVVAEEPVSGWSAARRPSEPDLATPSATGQPDAPVLEPATSPRCGACPARMTARVRGRGRGRVAVAAGVARRRRCAVYDDTVLADLRAADRPEPTSGPRRRRGCPTAVALSVRTSSVVTTPPDSTRSVHGSLRDASRHHGSGRTVPLFLAHSPSGLLSQASPAPPGRRAGIDLGHPEFALFGHRSCATGHLGGWLPGSRGLLLVLVALELLHRQQDRDTDLPDVNVALVPLARRCSPAPVPSSRPSVFVRRADGCAPMP